MKVWDLRSSRWRRIWILIRKTFNSMFKIESKGFKKLLKMISSFLRVSISYKKYLQISHIVSKEASKAQLMEVRMHQSRKCKLLPPIIRARLRQKQSRYPRFPKPFAPIQMWTRNQSSQQMCLATHREFKAPWAKTALLNWMKLYHSLWQKWWIVIHNK